MPYTRGYSMSWNNASDNQLLVLRIVDTTSFTSASVDTSYGAMSPATGNPVEISFTDNSQDKFTPTMAQKLSIRFNSTTNINFSTFGFGADNRWLVTLVATNNSIYEVNLFTGYLVLDNFQQPFLPHPQVVTLVATDNLKTLSDVTLVDNGVNPKGKYRLIDYISLALRKTNLQLDINVACSVMFAGDGVVSTSAQFNNSGSQISVSLTEQNVAFFRVGKSFTVSGTVSNNFSTTVTAVTNVVFALLVTVSHTLVNETITATFTDSDSCIFSNIYLDAKTFEKDINVSLDCLTVIEMILNSLGLRILQWQGAWWITGPDEMRHYITYYNYLYDGTYVGSHTVTKVKQIGSGLTIQMRDAAALVSLLRPNKSVQITYPYTFPKEIIDNIDLQRGALSSTVSSTEKHYNLDDWTLKTIQNSNGTETSEATATVYIKKLFNDQGQEKERYAVFEPGSFISGKTHMMKSNAVEMSIGDKFTFSSDWRLSIDLTGTTPVDSILAMITLEGDDGSKWVFSALGGVLDEPFKYKWRDYSSAISFVSVAIEDIPDNQDETSWQSLSVDVLPLPVSGKVYFYLANWNQSLLTVAIKTHWSNISLDYKPLINGSYQTYTKQYHKFLDDNGNKAKTEVEVKISDGVKKLFQGALLYKDGTTYFLATQFYNSQDGVSAGFGIDRLGKYVANIYWNQYRKETRLFELRLQGLGLSGATTDIPGLIHKYEIGDINYQSTNRWFMSVSMSQNLRDNSWTNNIMEVVSLENGYEYDNAKHDYKYVI